MNTSPHIHSDTLQALFEALHQPTASSGFEQEAMRRVYCAAQKKWLADEQKRMRLSTLWAAAIAACATAVIVSGLVWLHEQQPALAQFLQEVNLEQTLKFSAKEYLWVLAIGALIWLLSLPQKSYSA
jgi:ABC-type uncharacterized transport system fused permease/ATPase subunit